MSQPRHRRRVGLAVATLAAGMPLLVAGTAYAEPAESGREVVFNGGGLLGVSCAAKANKPSVTVPAESTLRIVNRTGHRATLVLDGRPRGEIGKNSAAEVLFHRGPVTLGLKPHCVLPEESAVRVQVTAQRPADSAPPPAGPSTPTAPSSGGTSDSLATGAGEGGTTARGHGDDRRATPAAVGDRSAEPTTAAGDGSTTPEDPSVIGAATTGPDNATVEELAAEPLGSVEPLTDRGPIGLLALIAIVCVMGVSAGAIRTILTQRASRARLA